MAALSGPEGDRAAPPAHMKQGRSRGAAALLLFGLQTPTSPRHRGPGGNGGWSTQGLGQAENVVRRRRTIHTASRPAASSPTPPAAVYPAAAPVSGRLSEPPPDAGP